MTESTPRHPSTHSRAGLCGDDVERLDRALTGIAYPAPKWQLLAHAHDDAAGRGRARNLRAIDLLWAVPNDDYRDRDQVLSSAARTARGHPRRPSSDSTPWGHRPRSHRPRAGVPLLIVVAASPVLLQV